MKPGWALALLGAVVLTAGSAAWALDAVLDRRSPGELIRHLQRRLIGHPKLEAVALPPLAWLQARSERPVMLVALPTLGRGPQPAGAVAAAQAITVDSVPALAQALRAATAGAVIEIAPGRYRITGTLSTGQPGRADAPITLRAGRPGSVLLESATTEAFRLTQVHWVIEHLSLRGVCERDHDCEHAFHVVGAAVGTVIRHNRLEDFNAAIKVNGERGSFPDDGRIEHNHIANRAPRRTDRPVTPIDIVAASRWTVSDNLIANFVKDGGDGISYGAFMKGGGRGGRFERNLVLCTPTGISQPGVRVGLSLGGGGTSASACREQPCLAEHSQGVIADNIVAHCNDVGIDVNASPGAELRHNTLINTAGIGIRNEPASARVRANLLDGRVRVRPPGRLETADNLQTDLRTIFSDADALALGWASRPSPVPSADEAADFCGRPRGASSPPGALVDGPC